DQDNVADPQSDEHGGKDRPESAAGESAATAQLITFCSRCQSADQRRGQEGGRTSIATMIVTIRMCQTLK
ncbi:MAG TPA: hypothetical protein VFW13_10090, partial [Phenylobacterium sp.]|nr:hypothetical protein [Phenylobacterium sp.]